MDGRMEKGSFRDAGDPLRRPVSILNRRRQPDSGGELCIADLEGTWRMSAGEEQSHEFSPEEKHMASLLNIERRWSDGEEGGYILQAEYYSARLLDTDTPQYETQKELLVEKREEPL